MPKTNIHRAEGLAWPGGEVRLRGAGEQPALSLGERHRAQREELKRLDLERSRALEPMRPAPGAEIVWDECNLDTGRRVQVTTYQTSRYQREVWREERRLNARHRDMASGEAEAKAAREAEKAARAVEREAARVRAANEKAAREARNPLAVKRRKPV